MEYRSIDGSQKALVLQQLRNARAVNIGSAEVKPVSIEAARSMTAVLLVAAMRGEGLVS